MSDAKKAETLPRPLPDVGTRQGINEVLERGGQGDESMIPLLRDLFARDQAKGGPLIGIYGDGYTHAREALLRHAAGDNLAVQEAMRRKIDAVRDELAGPDPTPLERILCERAALCWFDAHEADRRYIDQSEISFKAAEYREGRRDCAHRRFLAACKTLATVRRLGVPAIQVNVARRQVNVAGST